MWRKYLIQSLGLTERQGAVVGLEGLASGTAQKDPKAVRETIDAFREDDRIAKDKIGSLVGSIVNRLKALPATDAKPPSPEELEKAFAAPVAAEKEPKSANATLFYESWDRLEIEQRLADLSEEQTKKVKDAYNMVFGTTSPVDLEMDLKDFFKELGGELVAKDPSQRCEALIATINKFKPRT